jgi:hypothetical protein
MGEGGRKLEGNGGKGRRQVRWKQGEKEAERPTISMYEVKNRDANLAPVLTRQRSTHTHHVQHTYTTKFNRKLFPCTHVRTCVRTYRHTHVNMPALSAHT